MHIELYIKGNKIEPFINIGWYKGEDPCLFKLELLNKWGDDAMNIIYLQMFKFLFTIGVEWKSLLNK